MLNLSASIEVLLQQSDLFLGDCFSEPGNEVRKDLIARKEQGQLFLGDCPKPVNIQKKKADCIKREKAFMMELAEYVKSNIYPKEMIRAFFDYWREKNKSETKMKFEMERTWQTKLRLVTWEKNNQRFNKGLNKSTEPITNDNERIAEQKRKIERNKEIAARLNS